MCILAPPISVVQSWVSDCPSLNLSIFITIRIIILYFSYSYYED